MNNWYKNNRVQKNSIGNKITLSILSCENFERISSILDRAISMIEINYRKY
jgi:mannitol-1-phosphate/altronate dehydrogenase